MSKTMEEVVREETEKVVNRVKEKCKTNNITFENRDELMLKTGIAYGIMIAGLSITQINLDSSILGEKYKDEIKNS